MAQWCSRCYSRKSWALTQKREFCSPIAQNQTVLILFFSTIAFIFRAFPSLNEFQIPRLLCAGDIALNAVFTWLEIRRLGFIASKPEDARTRPFTIAELARIHYSSDRLMTIIALHLRYIYCDSISSPLNSMAKFRINGYVCASIRRKEVGTIHIYMYWLLRMKIR